MTNERNLLVEPKGDLTGDTLEPGFEVEILKESEGWAKVKVMDTDIIGWVPRNTVGNDKPAEDEADNTIDRATFFRQCWREGLSSNVVPHYLAAIAELRSGIALGEKDGEISPFRFTTGEWNAGLKDSALGMLDFFASDIKHWDMQCAMFAAKVHFDLDKLETAVLLPSAAKLYLAQLIGPKAATAAINSPLDTIEADLNSVQDADLPAGYVAAAGPVRNQILTRYSKYLRDNGPVSGTEALNRIADDLQVALNTVKNGIITAGTEVLGVAAGQVPVIITDPNAAGLPHAPSPGQLPNLPGGPPPPDAPGAGGILGKLISSGEGGYGSFNRGVAGDSARQRINFAQMTMGELAIRQSLPKGHPQRLFAVGKYQVIPDTMRGARSALAIADNQTYNPVLQERIFREYLIAGKRPQVKAFIAGAGNLRAAQIALAREFASVAHPDTGLSVYGGIGGNRASISAAKAATALQQEQQRYQQLLAANGAAAAWKKLSPGIP